MLSVVTFYFVVDSFKLFVECSVLLRRFEMNLETDSGDKALHFNPRFEGMNKVIRNTCRSGSWGSEEKGGHFPFNLGAPFEIAIMIEEHHFKVT